MVSGGTRWYQLVSANSISLYKLLLTGIRWYQVISANGIRWYKLVLARSRWNQLVSDEQLVSANGIKLISKSALYKCISLVKQVYS